MKTIGWIGAASAALVACASSPVPADKLAKSTAAVRSAHEVGAEKVPPAALHLKVANEELDLAKKLIAEGDNNRAELKNARSAYQGATQSPGISSPRRSERSTASDRRASPPSSGPWMRSASCAG